MKNFLKSGLLPVALLAALLVASQFLQGQVGGRTLVFALASGTVLGLVLQRSRFCFYCHARDWFEDSNPRGLLAIVLALAVGVVVFMGGHRRRSRNVGCMAAMPADGVRETCDSAASDSVTRGRSAG